MSSDCICICCLDSPAWFFTSTIFMIYHWNRLMLTHRPTDNIWSLYICLTQYCMCINILEMIKLRTIFMTRWKLQSRHSSMFIFTADWLNCIVLIAEMCTCMSIPESILELHNWWSWAPSRVDMCALQIFIIITIIFTSELRNQQILKTISKHFIIW